MASKQKRRKVPEVFFCPITHELMRDPVSTVDGLTYERSAIETWLATNDTSPLTGKQLASPLQVRVRAHHWSVEVNVSGIPPAIADKKIKVIL